MYAVFEDGSRQYRVTQGDEVRVDYRDAEPGNKIQFDRVLLVADGTETRIGQPTVAGSRVVAEVVEQTSEKYVIQHFRRRKNYRRLKGHRQPYTLVRIRHILLAGQEAPPDPVPAPAPAATDPVPAPAT
jgi:large subunit ribosomal protein L21